MTTPRDDETGVMAIARARYCEAARVTSHCERSEAIQGSWIATAFGLAMTSRVAIATTPASSSRGTKRSRGHGNRHREERSDPGAMDCHVAGSSR